MEIGIEDVFYIVRTCAHVGKLGIEDAVLIFFLFFLHLVYIYAFSVFGLPNDVKLFQVQTNLTTIRRAAAGQ